jgi:hypothetical protein
MRFEAHGFDTNRFVTHEAVNMRHNRDCGAWMIHKTRCYRASRRVIPNQYREFLKEQNG